MSEYNPYEEIEKELESKAMMASKAASEFMGNMEVLHPDNEEEMVDYTDFDLPPLSREFNMDKPKLEAWKVALWVLICLLLFIGSYFVGKIYGAELIPQDEQILFINGDEGFDSPVPGESEGDVNESSSILTVLLMGTDERPGEDIARSDVAMLCAINLETYHIDLISIPRDTRCAIADTELTRKINYAHSTGGSSRMVKTVENLLGINVHYYAEVNFTGFSKCIDILGGIDYNVESNMYLPDEGIDLAAGMQHLDGTKALQYVRWRGDAQADIGRIGRQQKFLSALLDQAISLGTITKMPDLIGTLAENLKTDMTLPQMAVLATKFATADNITLTTYMLPGEAKTINGAAYWVLDEEATKEIIYGVFAK